MPTAVQKSSRRAPLRMDAQDGPWSVSVADNPYDKGSYNIYIKTPTHNLTLTRSASEIVELHHKLVDANPASALPALPLDLSSVALPPKRKSTFLNTLSRLASPAGKSTARHPSGRRPPSPMRSPSAELRDPFTDVSSSAAARKEAASTVSSSSMASPGTSSLASYLTVVANDGALRSTRPWKRFFRVRTDDLESVRVERAIKRVRSDLAAHISPKSPKGSYPDQSQDGVISLNEAESIAWSENEPPAEEKEEKLAEAVPDGHAGQDDQPHAAESVEAVEDVRPSSPVSVRTTRTARSTPAVPVEASAEPAAASILDNTVDDEANGTSTPVSHEPDGHVPRIPRSMSAEQTKNSRLSRAFSSPTSTSNATPSETGDEYESSISTSTARRKKKRARSTDPNKLREPKKSTRKVTVNDFEMLRVLGKGCAGKVLLVRHKQSADLYALKAITKRHVLAHQELQHTLTEQAVLKRMAADGTDPFVVKLWWSFHDRENLFLVMDFHPGGDLATQLARWGRLGRDRARFYAAEIVEGVEGLHAAGVIYRDLKPENVLIGADGHIVLTDFGLSKEFPRRTNAITAPPTPSGSRGDFYSATDPSPDANVPAWMKTGKPGDLSGWSGPVGQQDTTSTFCGTAEYLAPEVIQGLPYSYEVDWWSFGTMLYEMLTGITPFWANNHADMYVRVLQDELQFPDDRTMDQDTKSLIRGLLQRNPALRLCEPRIKKHPYFSMIDWSHVYYKRYIPPYIPPIDPSNAGDTQNFDDTFLDMAPVVNDPNDQDNATDTDREETTDTDRTDGEDSVQTPLQSRSPSVQPVADDTVDVFDGYSFKGRHSVLLDDDEPDSSEQETDEEEERRSETPSHTVEDKTPVVPTAETVTPETAVEVIVEDVPTEEEPKTPEARKAPLPEVEAPAAPSTPVEESPKAADVVPEPTKQAEAVPAPRPSKEVRIAEPSKAEAPPKEPSVDEKESLDTVPPMQKPPVSRQPTRQIRGRKEKSGIPALDRYLSEDEGGVTELEDDDWDFVEAAGEEERNGSRGTTLFARGVVDRYKLSVFRKGPASTPQKMTSRSVSTVTTASELLGSDIADSPSPLSKKQRGRTPLAFRRAPKEFLRAKSPPTSFSPKSRGSSKILNKSSSAALSASSTSSANILTPSTSMASSTPPTTAPSLRTKQSIASVGTTPSMSSSDSQGANGDDHSPTPPDKTPGEDRPKNNKNVLKKYKEASEKVLSLFASPRQP
ncbi:hypothetical protein PUNSTDRAFT_80494 [Punctularia strigosozonata HHB-11173 SS5]|uniref:uncharacterized protein n=1 Tax=Punctularia strigosozonata (strain HHB-11173) TaxID=741275 RepID=UPI0004417396|nr:uncharacterized protein PUNSTDRAFT_80494 [Punctularia strigosozonata HHB-11173 SS5]EIN14271.1 hypothetical protein PUNSTDRAFT_80494 [Punctularia strigosozonata HHB-11173 SS5]